jgi:serine/threonine protein kinase
MPQDRAQSTHRQSSPQPKLSYQEQSRCQWVVVEEFGVKGGGCNGGIAKVEAKDDPYDRCFIEKRFKAEHVDFGLAHKEIALLHQLSDYPGVVRMVDHFVDPARGKASVYLEYCDGKDLEAVVVATSKGTDRVHERKIWKWFIGLIDTLVYLHRGPEPEDDAKVLKYWNVIYHRDIKPPNILLKTDYKANELVAKLADFGCSDSGQWMFDHKKVQKANIASAFTPGYEPPEHPMYSGASDVWQLALCMASVCTGITYPWSRRFPQGQRWSKKQPAGKCFSKELNEILAWCLNEDMKRRPKPMDIAKRLRSTYEKLKLPVDNHPLVAIGNPGAGFGHFPPPFASPGPQDAGHQSPMQDTRPGLGGNTFSDPAVERMEYRRDRYDDFVHGQRFPMHLMTPGGREWQHYGLPGGFIPMHVPGRWPPGSGPTGFPFGYSSLGYGRRRFR